MQEHMHYHLEIVLPPVEDLSAAVAQIMKPFDECPDTEGEDEDASSTRNSFWDWYVIGGRWAGTKLECSLDSDRKEAFFAELTKRNITVSTVQAGKHELSPASQIPMVDALWNEFFPDAPVKVCPFFNHFNDQYKGTPFFPDVMTLGQTPKNLTASSVIVAGPGWKDDGTLEARYLIQDQVWNGVNFVVTQWDGLVSSAIEKYLERYKEAAVAKFRPADDWLVVTVDYHS